MTATNALVAIALGLAAGVLSGMFGIGGGLVIVPALIILFGDETKTAIGTSLFALMWPVGLLGVLEYWKRGDLRVGQGAWIALGLFLGAYVGAKITGAISASNMKVIYGVFLLLMGSYFVFTSQNTATPRQKPPQVQEPPHAGGDPVQVH